MNSQLIQAIRNRRVVEFQYHGQQRVVEPFTYGVEKDTGNEVLSAFQIGGQSNSGGLPAWRLFSVSEISGLRATPLAFTASRPGYNRNDSRMSQILAAA